MSDKTQEHLQKECLQKLNRLLGVYDEGKAHPPWTAYTTFKGQPGLNFRLPIGYAVDRGLHEKSMKLRIFYEDHGITAEEINRNGATLLIVRSAWNIDHVLTARVPDRPIVPAGTESRWEKLLSWLPK